MNALIIYDSVFGNTGEVARTIGDTVLAELASQGETHTLSVGKVTQDQLVACDLLIVGSPTRSFRPTSEISDLLKSLHKNQLSGVWIAAFDTRICLDTIDSSALRFIIDKGGYAASTIAKSLQKKKGRLVAEPIGFLVTGEEGPLKDGELERATNWTKELVKKSGLAG